MIIKSNSKKIIAMCLAFLMIILAGCANNSIDKTTSQITTTTLASTQTTTTTQISTTITTTTTEATTIPSFATSNVYPDKTMKKIKNGFSYSMYSGDYGLDKFLSGGGAKTEEDLITFFVECIALGKVRLDFTIPGIGCSTISVPNKDGGNYFGRNFDWDYCNTLIMVTKPTKGYKSISTVNTSFLSNDEIKLTDDMIRFCAVYSPLDGMNEKGLCISVNMVNDSSKINQNTSKKDLTTTTAVRLVLDRAATVDEAVNLLKSYDLHGSYGYMIHYAISDRSGKSVVVEYINNQLIVTETPVVTNFYLTKGNKYGIGSKESITRYDTLMALLKENPKMDINQVKDALSQVSKHNNEFKTTVWSVIFDQKNLTATYFCGGNFSKGYVVSL